MFTEEEANFIVLSLFVVIPFRSFPAREVEKFKIKAESVDFVGEIFDGLRSRWAESRIKNVTTLILRGSLSSQRVASTSSREILSNSPRTN